MNCLILEELTYNSMKEFSMLIALVLLFSCATKTTPKSEQQKKFVIAFGSCNDQNRSNILWNDILKNEPDVWIWGGDNIYADTEDMQKMESDYMQLKNNPSYKNLVRNSVVLGTWDDHDYGKNDAGLEYVKKDSSQQLFLDFLDVPDNDERRNKKGIYHTQTFKIGDKIIKIIILDTRFFRTALTKDPTGQRRYIPNKTDKGTILGDAQWHWLTNELHNSSANFNVIISSIQFLSQEHGWESWGNMPSEIIKMENLIINSKAKGVIFLSGDRHISEISKINLPHLTYPLFDFTSSGLTHTYEAFESEINTNRVSKVITEKNFGTLTFNLESDSILMEIRGAKNLVLESINHQY